MSNRLETRVQALVAESARGVAPYLTAGDGGMDVTLEVLQALDAGGASCVELGVPFSDPIADGPVLQAAAHRMLASRLLIEIMHKAIEAKCLTVSNLKDIKKMLSYAYQLTQNKEGNYPMVDWAWKGLNPEVFCFPN